MSVHGQQLAALAEYASESITVGSKSFAGASRLFDRELRASSQMLYAWCRYCDDVIDGQESGFQAESQPETEVGERLRHLRELTQAAIDGHADTPAFAALSYVLHRHDIPARFPMELLDGFEMDVLEHQFSTIDDTIEYSYYVAGVVGIMMAMIMGVRDDGTLDRACDLGIGFQLTNICRDVMDDAAIGRVYLPEDWLREHGVEPQSISAPEHRGAVFAVASRVLDIAESYYDSAYYGLRELPFRAACAIGTARRVYREIGRQVRRREFSAWDQRTVVGKRRKMAGAMLAVLDCTYAHSVGRIISAPERDNLWTRSR